MVENVACTGRPAAPQFGVAQPPTQTITVEMPRNVGLAAAIVLAGDIVGEMRDQLGDAETRRLVLSMLDDVATGRRSRRLVPGWQPCPRQSTP